MVVVRPAKGVRKNIFNFMGLPAEIRNLIYEYISSDFDKLRGAVAIISVSQQIRREALPIIYGDLRLYVDVDLWRLCRHDKHSTLLYPVQTMDDRLILSCETSGSASDIGSGLMRMRGTDRRFNLLSYLKQIRVTLYETAEGETTEEKARFDVHLPSGAPDEPRVDVEFETRDRYKDALTGLLTAEVCYWIKRHGHGRFCEDSLNRLLEPIKMIQRAMYQEDNP